MLIAYLYAHLPSLFSQKCQSIFTLSHLKAELKCFVQIHKRLNKKLYFVQGRLISRPPPLPTSLLRL